MSAPTNAAGGGGGGGGGYGGGYGGGMPAGPSQPPPQYGGGMPAGPSYGGGAPAGPSQGGYGNGMPSGPSSQGGYGGGMGPRYGGASVPPPASGCGPTRVDVHINLSPGGGRSAAPRPQAPAQAALPAPAASVPSSAPSQQRPSLTMMTSPVAAVAPAPAPAPAPVALQPSPQGAPGSGQWASMPPPPPLGGVMQQPGAMPVVQQVPPGSGGQRLSAPRISVTAAAPVIVAAQPMIPGSALAATPGSAMSSQRSEKKTKTLKFGHRESYEAAERPSRGHVTEISSVSMSSGAQSPTGDASPVVMSLTEENMASFGSRPSMIQKRCSVISAPSPQELIQTQHRMSAISCVSEFWEDDTVDEEQLKAATKLSNKLAARRGAPAPAKK